MVTRLGAGPDNVRLGCGRGELQLMVKIAAQETDHAESFPSPRPPRESLPRAESSTNPMHAPNPLPLSFVSVWVFAGYCDWQNSFFGMSHDADGARIRLSVVPWGSLPSCIICGI